MPKQRLRTPFVSISRKFILFVVAGLIAFAALWWLWSQRNNLGYALQNLIARSLDAKVEQVMVEGVSYTDPDDLRAALQLQKGDPLFGFNVQEARERVEALPWVARAAIRKQLLDTVSIQIFEHHPFARLQTETGEEWVINKLGAQIVLANEEFMTLPLLTGGLAGENAAALFLQLQNFANLNAALAGADYIGERRWNLVFKSGLTAKLPAEKIDVALALLQQLEERRHVLTLSGGTVDLRLPDRIVLELPVDASGRELVL